MAQYSDEVIHGGAVVEFPSKRKLIRGVSKGVTTKMRRLPDGYEPFTALRVDEPTSRGVVRWNIPIDLLYPGMRRDVREVKDPEMVREVLTALAQIAESHIQSLGKFNVGMKVRFGVRGRILHGWVIRINSKRLSVETNEGVWKVPPEMLEAD